MNLTTDPDWHDLHAAIGGGPLLVEHGRVVTDPIPPVPGERNSRFPVVAIGVAQDGRTLILVEVDGRQPHLSIGLTQPQLAAYMQWLGAYEAMAFDSGGSATLVARLPGRPHPAVLNSPSDGTERPVADALLFYTTAVPGPAVRLLVNANQPLRLFTGATAPLSIIGVDAQGNPVTPPEPVRVSAVPQLVTVTSSGLVRAGEIPGTGVLRAESGMASGAVPLSIIARLNRLVVRPEAVLLVPGAWSTFTVTGEDAAGRPVVLPGGAGTWTVTPSWLGRISAPGRFVAGARPGAGTISVLLGGAASHVNVHVAEANRSPDPARVGARRQEIQ